MNINPIEDNETLDAPMLDSEKQEKARRYSKINKRLMLIDLALGLLYLFAWLTLGWSRDLKLFLENITNIEWIIIALFLFIFGGIFMLINLPLSFYEGFVLPHQFGLSNQNLKDWIIDQIKAGLLGGILGLVILEVIYAVLRIAPETWWLWAAGILLLFNIILANLAPVLLFPIFYKFQPLGDEYAELETRLLSLAKESQTYVKGVYKFDMSRRTKAANAGLTGLGNTRRIILGDTLLNEFHADEIETVMAHELGHHVHKDIPLGIIIESAITLLGLYFASWGLNWGVNVFGFEGVWDIAGFPLFTLVIGAFGLITMPLTNAYSRWRERMADRYALEITKNGSAYASALTRLANQNLAQADPPAWEVFFLHSHPALSKRIAMAQEYEKI